MTDFYYYFFLTCNRNIQDFAILFGFVFLTMMVTFSSQRKPIATFLVVVSTALFLLTTSTTTWLPATNARHSHHTLRSTKQQRHLAQEEEKENEDTRYLSGKLLKQICEVAK